MAIPASAKRWDQSLDPSDEDNFELDLRSEGLLDPDEEIATFTLTLPAESVALGLTILSDGPHAAADDGEVIIFWINIDPGSQDEEDFIAGAPLPIEVSIETTSTPPRKLQRTAIIRVVQQ